MTEAISMGNFCVAGSDGGIDSRLYDRDSIPQHARHTNT